MKKTIGSVLKEAVPYFRSCYIAQNQLAARPDAYYFKSKFLINKDGTVSNVKLSKKNELPKNFTKCFVKILTAVKFPEVKDPAGISTIYPFNFYLINDSESYPKIDFDPLP